MNTSSIYKIPDPPLAAQFNKLYSPLGAQLATRVWSSSCNNKSKPRKPRALILLVHGYGFHSGYFNELATRLSTNQGIFCASFDQVCQGYYESEPGAPSGYIHVDSFDDWVADIFTALAWAKTECGGFKDIPVFFLGESFGGLEVLEAAMQSKSYGVEELAGVITTGAVLQVHPDVLPPAPIVKLLTWLAPCFPKLKMPNDAKLEASYDVAFGDVEWARLIRLDEKVQTAPKSTLAVAVGVLTTGPKIMMANNGNVSSSLPCPLLAFHAKGDTRVSIQPIMTFVDQLGPEKAQGVWVDSMGHQLFQDKREVTLAVIDKIASWIDTQLMNKKQKSSGFTDFFC